LEEEAKENIFDWIRDFKDFEIRTQLQTQIDTLRLEVDKRDQKVLKLQIKLEEMVMHADIDPAERELLHDESYQIDLNNQNNEGPPGMPF